MDLRGGAEAKTKLFQNMVMLHIKFKLTSLEYFARRHTLVLSISELPFYTGFIVLKIVSEDDQEIPRSQTADKPVAS